MTHDEWIMESFKEGYEDGHGQAVTDMEGYLRDALSHGVTVDMDFIYKARTPVTLVMGWIADIFEYQKEKYKIGFKITVGTIERVSLKPIALETDTHKMQS